MIPFVLCNWHNAIIVNVFCRNKTKNDKISYMFDILITCRKYLQEGIISLRREVWTHQTSFTPVLFIEVHVPSKESERSRMCVFSIYFATMVSTIVELFWIFLFWNYKNTLEITICFIMTFVFSVSAPTQVLLLPLQTRYQWDETRFEQTLMI